MSTIGAKGQKKPGRYLLALLMLAIGAVAAYWALTALFPAELHEIGQWLQARLNALRN